MFQARAERRNRDDVRPAPMIARAMIFPLAAFGTGVAVLLLALSQNPHPAGWLAVIVAWVIALIVREALRVRSVRRLLIPPKTRMEKLDPAAWRITAAAGPTLNEADPSLVRELRSRRLIVLCGDRRGGASRKVFDALRVEFGRYQVLRPVWRLAGGNRPLGALLASGLLPLHGRYVLWLGDLAQLLDNDLDPRLIERWLGAGRGRIAIGTISIADRRRLTAPDTPQSVAFKRARFLRDELPPGENPARSVRERLNRERESSELAGEVMRVAAAFDVFGVSGPSDAVIAEVVQKLVDTRPPPDLIESLCSGEWAPLRREHGALVPEVELAAIVDEELSLDLDAQLLEAIEDTADAAGLIAIGRALTARRRFDDAEHALELAEQLTGDDLALEIGSAQTSLVERRDGASGAALSMYGGYDFSERMGPAQRSAVARQLPDAPDGVFDPTSPPETTARATRFYRLQLTRGFARVGTLILLDALALTVASIVALAIRAETRPGDQTLIGGELVSLIGAGTAAMVVVGVFLGLYRPDAARCRIGLILTRMAVVSTIIAAGFFVADVQIGSLIALGALFWVGVGADWGLRGLYDWKSRRWVQDHRLHRRVLVLGDAPDARRIARLLRSATNRPTQPVAFLSPQPCHDPFCVGRYRDLERRLHGLHIGEIVIVDPTLDAAAKAALIGRAQSFGIDVRIVPNPIEVILGSVGRVGELGFVSVPAALLRPEALALKRLLDRVVVIATVPVWGLIIASYAAYSGLRWRHQPVFVHAERLGLGQVPFQMFRLRTRRMRADGSRGAKASGRVERFLERTGLDELPQVFNILRDEMSAVGPRPLAARDVDQLGRDERRTLGARPGMTGRWQVEWPHGVGESEMRTLDADYLRRWRIIHDLELMLRTPGAIIRRGALGDTRLGEDRESAA
jgi:lipopolysaccharide/colanic/teichoic acid biosynthesis glycosyltransferase